MERGTMNDEGGTEETQYRLRLAVSLALAVSLRSHEMLTADGLQLEGEHSEFS
jgi:hypothetical protein